MIDRPVLAPPGTAPTTTEPNRRAWWRRDGRVDGSTRVQAELQRHYRQIVAQLLLGERPAAPWLIGVTSAIQGEGKTTVAYGLATTLAAGLGERVVLVELDFARPVVAAELGVPPVPGLAEVIQDYLPLTAASRATHLPNLLIVPAGQPQGDVARLVHSPRLAEVWAGIGQLGAIVVCDLPHVLGMPETPFLARQMTTLLLAVRAGVTPAPLTRQALALLDRARVAGVVLNGEEHRLPRWLRRALGDW